MRSVKGWTPAVLRALAACLLAAASGCATSKGPSRAAAAGASPGLPPERAAFADALAHFSRGISHEWGHDTSAAYSNFQQAAQLDPDNEELQFRAALGLLQQRRTDEAVAVMERLARRHPRSERAQLWAAFVYRAVDRADDALAAYDRAIRANPASPIAYIEKASLFTRLNRADDAVALLERAVGRVKDPTELLRLLGDIYLRQATLLSATGGSAKRMKAALRIFERAVAPLPDDQALLFQLGDLYVLNGEFEKAVRCFERIEALNPNDLRIKQKLAMSLLAKGDRQKALATLERLLDRDPTNARVLYYLAHLYEQTGDVERAILNYGLAIKAAPDDPAAYLRLSMLYVAADRSDEAVRTLNDGLARLPSEARFLELQAYIHLGSRNYEQALACFAKAQARMEETGAQPITPNFHLNHAIATQLAGRTGDAASLLYEAMGINRAYLDAYVHYVVQEPGGTNLASSVRVLTKLGEKTPEDPSLFLYIGLLNSYAKLYPAAIAAFEKAEKLAAAAGEEEDILTPSFFFWFGSACERQGDFDRAVELFKKCIAMEPDPADRQEYRSYVDALNYLAYMWAERGQELDQALSYVQRALEANPKSEAYIDTLGWIYFMQERYEEALQEISRALDLRPEDPTITDHMGDVQEKLGKPEEAVSWWRKSFVLDPENEKVAEKLTARGVDLDPLREEAEARRQQEREKAAASAPAIPGIDLVAPDDEPAEREPVIEFVPESAPF